MPDRSLEIDSPGVNDMGGVKSVQHTLRAKGMTCTDGGNDLFSNGSSFTNELERLLHVFGDELVHETASDGNHGNDRGHGEGDFPLLGVGEYETDEESGQETGRHWDLLGNTLMYEI